MPKHDSGRHETNETIDEIIVKRPAGRVLCNERRKAKGDRQMLKLRYLLIPLGAVATIVALSAQTASHATTREPAVAMVSEQLVTCTDENRKTVDICIVADTLSH